MIAPALHLEPRDVTRLDNAWRIRWHASSADGEHLRIVAIRAPHVRFRSDRVDLDAIVAENATVEHTVRLEAAPGEVIDDASVVLVVVRGKQTWRVVFGVRVRVGADGTPALAVLGSTPHVVGVSEI